MKGHTVMLNLFQHPLRRRTARLRKWTLKRVQGDGLRLALATALLSLAACAATQQPDAVAPTAPGFLLGLWHGFIFPVAWILSLFMKDVAIYAVPNNGGWYDFGFFIGVVFLGVGSHRGSRTVYVRTRRG